MADITDIVGRILRRAKGAPKSLIRMELIDVARRFCRDTRVAQFAEQVSVLTGESVVLLVGSPEYEIVDVRSIRDDQGYRYDTGDGPMGYHQTGNTITLNKPVIANRIFFVTYSHQPSYDATMIDDQLLSLWYEGLEHGVLAGLKNMEGSEWYSPQESGRHEQFYREQVAKARRVAVIGVSGGSTSINNNIGNIWRG